MPLIWTAWNGVAGEYSLNPISCLCWLYFTELWFIALCQLYDYKLHYNDTFIINGLISIPTTGKVPDGRTWHSLSAVSDKHLFLYGGFNNQGEALGETSENFKLQRQKFFF